MTEDTKQALVFLFFGSVLILCLSLTGCTPINKYFGMEDDNFVEEIAEAAVYIETGLNIDFSPSSPE